jgi:hypothetical protein
MKTFDPRLEFHCPKCLSTHYGTSGSNNWDTAEGYCNGRDGGCRFRWKRSEDWKVFYIVQITKFETLVEFQTAQETVDY